jgi:hypothetical protein
MRSAVAYHNVTRRPPTLNHAENELIRIVPAIGIGRRSLADRRVATKRFAVKGLSPIGRTACFHHVETCAKAIEDGLKGGNVSSIVNLAWIAALIKELFTVITLVADVDEVTFGQRDERASVGRRPALVGIEGIGARQFGKHFVSGCRGSRRWRTLPESGQ